MIGVLLDFHNAGSDGQNEYLADLPHSPSSTLSRCSTTRSGLVWSLRRHGIQAMLYTTAMTCCSATRRTRYHEGRLGLTESLRDEGMVWLFCDGGVDGVGGALQVHRAQNREGRSSLTTLSGGCCSTRRRVRSGRRLASWCKSGEYTLLLSSQPK